MDERAADPQEWQHIIDDHEQTNEDENDYFPVWPENWKTLQIFLSLAHCFRQEGLSGHFLGLHRFDIESTLNMFNVRTSKRRTLFNQLIEMESAALEVLNCK